MDDIKLYTLTTDAKLQGSFQTSSMMIAVPHIVRISRIPIAESIRSLVSQAVPWTCCNPMVVV